MKFTQSWLQEYLETDAALEDITGALNEFGLEVEGVEDSGGVNETTIRACLRHGH